MAQRKMEQTMQNIDVVIVGAGPYGLSVAAHLRAIKGLEVVVFGEPMSFWENHMPAEMLLRSPWAGSHLSDPAGSLTLDTFRQSSGRDFSAPIPLKEFIRYGRWFQSQTVPEVDRRQVVMVETDPRGFLLTLSDDTKVVTQRLVIASGIGSFAWWPQTFNGLPSQLVSHTSTHRDLGKFAGKRVVIVGAGQSALESGALMHEAGVDVELLIRSPEVRFLWQRPWLHKWPVEPILYAPPDVGPAMVSHLVARPDLFRLLPRTWQDRLGVRSIRAAGAGWLKPRLENVKLLCGRYAVGAEAAGDKLRLKLDDGSEKYVDHALLGTGYRVDIRKHAFIARELLSSIRLADGYPQLNERFETSVPGLHFVGAPAAWSFGPLMRFVAGADFTARKLARGVARISGRQRLSRTAASSASSDRSGAGSASSDKEGESAPGGGEVDTHLQKANPPGVLLTGADYRALGAARSLGRQGVPVAVLRKSDQLLASFSRYVGRFFTWPRCDGDVNEGYLKYLLELAENHDLKGWFLFPTDDDMVKFVARHRDQLSEHFLLATPSWEELQWACDKRLLHDLADRLEIHHPQTFYPKSRAELQELACTFPVIIKPALHDSINSRPGQQPTQASAKGKTSKLTVDKAWRVDDRESLLAEYDRACTQIPAELIMIQELVPGWGDAQYSYAALCRRGEPVAALTARRLRQYPMDFGRMSTYVETIDEPEVARISKKLLRELDYTGLVEVEFKWDHRDGKFKLLDVNPRIWGWHTLGARAGVDFSYLFWRLLRGEPVADLLGRPGVGWMYPTADLTVAVKEILCGRLSLREYLRPLGAPLEMAIFVSDDPMPGLLALPLLLYSRFVRTVTK